MEKDAVTIAPHVHTIILENEKVRVLRALLKPGDAAAMHNHPNYILTVIHGGTMRMTNEKGEANMLDLKTGDSLFFEALSHAAENIGNTTVEMVLVELK